jgi:hypothetical protein
VTVIGNAIRRSWGECAWTVRDLLRPMRVPAPRPGVTVNVHPGSPEPPILVVIYRDRDGMLRRW